MSRFPDFMHMDLSKLTCSGCLMIVLSFAVAIGTTVVSALLSKLAISRHGRPGRNRWLMGLIVIGVSLSAADSFNSAASF